MSSSFNIIKNFLCFCLTIDLFKDRISLFILLYQYKITRSLGNKEQQQTEESCRESFRTEHVTPSFINSPHIRFSTNRQYTGCIFQNNRILMVAHNQEIHEVYYQHTEDDSKLVTRYKRSTNIRRSNFSNIHRTDCRSQSNTDTAQNTIQIKSNQQIHVRLSIFEKQDFRIIGT